jgi:hypothetical protein
MTAGEYVCKLKMTAPLSECHPEASEGPCIDLRIKGPSMRSG